MILACLGRFEGGLRLSHLVEGTSFRRQLHVCPDTTQQLFDRARIDDRAIIAVQNAAGRDIDHDLAHRQEQIGRSACIDPVDPQIAADLAQMRRGQGLNRQAIFRPNAASVEVEDILGCSHRALLGHKRDC